MQVGHPKFWILVIGGWMLTAGSALAIPPDDVLDCREDRWARWRVLNQTNAYLCFLQNPTCSGEPRADLSCLYNPGCGCGKPGLRRRIHDTLHHNCQGGGDYLDDSTSGGGYGDHLASETGSSVKAISLGGSASGSGDCDCENCKKKRALESGSGDCGCKSDCGCDECNSDSGGCPTCEECPTHTLLLFSGYEAFRGPAESNLQSNQGAVVGVNWGTRLQGDYGDRGWGLQAGASFGGYDWDGRTLVQTDQMQTQGFLTYGVYKRAACSNSWSVGIVQDWMFNGNYGAAATSPTLSQFRGLVAYAISDCDEFGVWGTLRDRGQTRAISTQFQFGTESYRAIDQVNLFHHHKWEFGGDTWCWAGFVGNSRLGGDGSVGDWTVGGMATAPLNDEFALYGGAQYMSPSAAPGPAASVDNIWDVSVGITFYLSGNARTKTVVGSCSMPLLNVANNGSFMVDSHRQ